MGVSGDSWLAELDRYIEDNLQAFLDDLAALCALPTVSAQARAIDETASAVRELLEKYGIQAEVLPTSGFPVVYGRAEGAGPRTLLCYNHYDVQPAEPFELWTPRRSRRPCATASCTPAGSPTTRATSSAGSPPSPRSAPCMASCPAPSPS